MSETEAARCAVQVGDPAAADECGRPLRLEWVDPATLDEHPRNWRRHPPLQREAMGGALDEVGWAGALLYNEATGRLLDGHMRRQVALAKGISAVPVLIGTWSAAAEAKILLTLDPLAELAEYDAVQLDAVLRETETSSEALALLLTNLSEEAGLLPPEDELPDLPRRAPAAPPRPGGDGGGNARRSDGTDEDEDEGDADDGPEGDRAEDAAPATPAEPSTAVPVTAGLPPVAPAPEATPEAATPAPQEPAAETPAAPPGQRFWLRVACASASAREVLMGSLVAGGHECNYEDEPPGEPAVPPAGPADAPADAPAACVWTAYP